MIERRLIEWLRAGVRAAAPELGLGDDVPEPELLEPKQRDHGDFATNVALALARRAGRAPRDVARTIVDRLPAVAFVERVEVAGPGFVNVWVTDEWLYDAVRAIAAQGVDYGRGAPDGRRVQVEFVSANPTGPLTLGHARNAAIGDALARLFAFTGWTVEREYYFNDAGGQMDRFGASVEARYLALLGREAPFPEDGYHGAYVEDLAREILDERGPALADLAPGDRLVALRDEAARRVLATIEQTLRRFGVRFDSYVSEADLAERGEIAEAIERLRTGGHVYELEGALWFRSTAFGDDKDRVVVRSSGRHTYFGADCAYLLDKYGRGFDRLVYVLGADHHGDVARLRGAATALGLDPARMELVIYQWVSFVRGGEPVPMSKRAGTFVTLDQLIDEVGVDAARFHLLMFSGDHAVNFDLEEVARRSLDNPVYYVQYGHARIASIIRTAGERGVELRKVDAVDLGRLTHETETDLLRALAEAPARIAEAAELRGPHRLTHQAQDVAARFHRFYAECRVVSDDAELTQARMWLCAATQQVLAILLDLLGVSAPQVMARDELMARDDA